MTSRDAVTGRKTGPHPLNKGKLPPHELDAYMMGEDDDDEIEDEPEDDD